MTLLDIAATAWTILVLSGIAWMVADWYQGSYQ